MVLKDVFDFTLEEIAENLSTTPGAIKTALSRGRGKLAEPADVANTPAPSAVLDAFCAAFNAGDLNRLTALLLDTSSVEVVGATTQYGPEAARRTVLWGMLFGAPRFEAVLGPVLMQRILMKAPRVEARAHRGGWVLLHWYAHEDGEAVRALTRLATEGDRIAHVVNHFYDPDLLADVCAELGVPYRVNGYRWC